MRRYAGRAGACARRSPDPGVSTHELSGSDTLALVRFIPAWLLIVILVPGTDFRLSDPVPGTDFRLSDPVPGTDFRLSDSVPGTDYTIEQVAGTHVTLDPPPGFVPAAQFPGFQKADAGASIMVTELPGPIAQVGAGLTREGLASRGWNYLDEENVTVGGRSARLVHFTQVQSGVTYEKWILAFGTTEQSVIVMGTVPKDQGDAFREPLRQALLSTRWDPARSVGMLDGLPFQFQETANLKISARVSSGVVLTQDGAKGPIPAEEPLLVVSASVSTVNLSNLEKFSRDRIAQTQQIKQVQNITGEAVTVNGLSAYELTADALDGRAGAPIRVYQLIADDGGNYFIVQGFTGKGTAPQFLPQFREVGRSLRKAK
jgi:hypothetical protein